MERSHKPNPTNRSPTIDFLNFAITLHGRSCVVCVLFFFSSSSFLFFFQHLFFISQKERDMPTITNSLATVSSGTTLLALSLIAGVSYYYLFNDKRFSLSERLYFLICKRNIQEALLEHELLQERK